MRKIIDDFSKDLTDKYDSLLIKACVKHGLVMSIETAKDFRVLEVLNKDYCILEHVPTGINICKWSKYPKIIYESNKATAYLNFIEM